MDSDKDRTLYCGNLSEEATEELLFELFIQAGPLERVHLPKDRDGKTRPFCFITYKHSISVPYAIQIYKGTNLFGRPLNLKPRSGSVHESGPEYEPDPICAPASPRHFQHHAAPAPVQPPKFSYNQMPMHSVLQQQVAYFPFNGVGAHQLAQHQQQQQQYQAFNTYGGGYYQQQQYQQEQYYQNGRGDQRQRDRDSKRRREDDRNHRSHRDRREPRSSRR